MSQTPTTAHRKVSVGVTLNNGAYYSYAWTTSLTMRRALSASRRWASRELKSEKVKGRSQWRSFDVFVKNVSGPFLPAPPVDAKAGK